MALVEKASDNILIIDAREQVVFSTPSFRTDYMDTSSDTSMLQARIHPGGPGDVHRCWQADHDRGAVQPPRWRCGCVAEMASGATSG